MEIKWNQAPEGFSIWLEDVSESKEIKNRSSWAREGRGEYEFPGGGYWAYSVSGDQYIAHKQGELK